MTIGHFYYHEAAQTSSTLMGIHALLLAILHMQETMQGHLSFVRHLCTMQFLFKILYYYYALMVSINSGEPVETYRCPLVKYCTVQTHLTIMALLSSQQSANY